MDTHSPPVDAAQIDALRQFNRFYTQKLGILASAPDSELSLTEVRVLHELAHDRSPKGAGPSAARIGALLGLDAGYLSRILHRFEARQWIRRSRSASDARQHLLELTEAGMLAYLPLQEKSIAQALATLAPLSIAQRHELTRLLRSAQLLLDEQAPPAPTDCVLRTLQSGDLGWVVQQHGALYAREYGWNQEFEGLVAQIVADYAKRKPDAGECGWIAERDGERLGSVFVMRKSPTVAQLRLLIVLPQARGQGLGARLTDTAMAFAREQRYRTMRLWTNSCLSAARAIYVKRGFVLGASEPYRGFGHDLVSETWDLRL